MFPPPPAPRAARTTRVFFCGNGNRMMASSPSPAPAPAPPSPALQMRPGREGYLSKQTSRLTSRSPAIKRYHFTLSSTDVTSGGSAQTLVWADKPGGKPRGKFEVSGATAVRCLPDNFSFEVVTHKSVVTLRAESDEERTAWGEALSDAFRRAMELKRFDSSVATLQKGEQFKLGGDPVVLMLTANRQALKLVGASSRELRVAKISSAEYSGGKMTLVADTETLELTAETEEVAEVWSGMLTCVVAYVHRRHLSLEAAAAAEKSTPASPAGSKEEAASLQSVDEAAEEDGAVDKASTKTEEDDGAAAESKHSRQPSSGPGIFARMRAKLAGGGGGSSTASRSDRNLTGGSSPNGETRAKAAMSSAAPSADATRSCIAHAFGVALSVNYGDAEYREHDGEGPFRAKTKFQGLRCSGSSFDFAEYAPAAFASLRKKYGVPSSDLCKSLSTLVGGGLGEGKSGQLFYVRPSGDPFAPVCSCQSVLEKS